ncbi:uncharacterized protein MYCFIDRAFT_172822 [Pseudocercospora fijiensis CIRAD86]|uniref:F-box domain-containing protein n=1 Tax=Pseudocercospora fijiensis (strain CIRAD86) TaxID=383855 RepID=M3B314_PSEFD|nr:uncharacterized protein MYCFIDRAFT_172822 [Pseudocercospora fijiensis CIRAD86]EME83747.1 hypothetical protein MYCFIDRAFT_172822 [Pseudocercospora fijiensis CIRAD86]
MTADFGQTHGTETCCGHGEIARLKRRRQPPARFKLRTQGQTLLYLYDWIQSLESRGNWLTVSGFGSRLTAVTSTYQAFRAGRSPCQLVLVFLHVLSPDLFPSRCARFCSTEQWRGSNADQSTRHDLAEPWLRGMSTNSSKYLTSAKCLSRLSQKSSTFGLELMHLLIMHPALPRLGKCVPAASAMWFGVANMPHDMSATNTACRAEASARGPHCRAELSHSNSGHPSPTQDLTRQEAKMPKVKKPRKSRRLGPTSRTKQTDSPQPITQPLEQNSKILNLPKELLSHILSYTLTREAPIILHSNSSRRWRTELATLNALPLCWGSAKKDRSLDILLVSKAFYFAGVEAFYSSNTFQFGSVTALTKLLNSIDSDRKNCIQKIRLLQFCNPVMSGYELESPEEMSLKELKGAETIPAGLPGKLPRLKQVRIRCVANGCYFHSEKERVMVRGMIQDVLRNKWGELPEGVEVEIEVVGVCCYDIHAGARSVDCCRYVMSLFHQIRSITELLAPGDAVLAKSKLQSGFQAFSSPNDFRPCLPSKSNPILLSCGPDLIKPISQSPSATHIAFLALPCVLSRPTFPNDFRRRATVSSAALTLSNTSPNVSSRHTQTINHSGAPALPIQPDCGQYKISCQDPIFLPLRSAAGHKTLFLHLTSCVRHWRFGSLDGAVEGSRDALDSEELDGRPAEAFDDVSVIVGDEEEDVFEQLRDGERATCCGGSHGGCGSGVVLVLWQVISARGWLMKTRSLTLTHFGWIGPSAFTCIGVGILLASCPRWHFACSQDVLEQVRKQEVRGPRYAGMEKGKLHVHVHALQHDYLARLTLRHPLTWSDAASRNENNANLRSPKKVGRQSYQRQRPRSTILCRWRNISTTSLVNVDALQHHLRSPKLMSKQALGPIDPELQPGTHHLDPVPTSNTTSPRRIVNMPTAHFDSEQELFEAEDSPQKNLMDLFWIPKIGEKILLDMHPADVFSTLRTNRQFKAIIDNSPALQKRLFLAQLPEDETLTNFKTWSITPDTAWKPNTLLCPESRNDTQIPTSQKTPRRHFVHDLFPHAVLSCEWLHYPVNLPGDIQSWQIAHSKKQFTRIFVLRIQSQATHKEEEEEEEETFPARIPSAGEKMFLTDRPTFHFVQIVDLRGQKTDLLRWLRPGNLTGDFLICRICGSTWSTNER